MRNTTRTTCFECHRRVGMLPSGRALPFTIENGRKRCADRGPCKRAQAAAAGSATVTDLVTALKSEGVR